MADSLLYSLPNLVTARAEVVAVDVWMANNVLQSISNVATARAEGCLRWWQLLHGWLIICSKVNQTLSLLGWPALGGWLTLSEGGQGKAGFLLRAAGLRWLLEASDWQHECEY
jgi:hypothetical protein